MQHEHHRVPVTALGIWNENVILAGEGTLLKAYDTDQKTLLGTVQVFEGQATHGIIVAEAGDGLVCAWGGQNVCFVTGISITGGKLDLKVGPIQRAEDWILDAAFSACPANESPKVALVTAHNALQIMSGEASGEQEVEPLVQGSKCILYCAHVTWLSSSQCLIASGTAFGDVIIWSCTIQDDEGKLSVQYQTHYTFAAHEGSVFGVRLSSPSEAGRLGDRQRILATCSDDRTIRLWDISDLSVKSPTLMEAQRQTGFGTTENDDSYAPPALGKIMGHISRIWHVRFEQDPVTGEVFVISFGEDASNITWSITATTGKSSELPYTLQQVDLQRAHNGKHIWSLAIKNSRIVTGGADGAIGLQRFWPSSLEHNASPGAENIVNDSSDLGTFRAYGFVNDSQVLASTDRGYLYLATLAEDGIAYSKTSDAIPGLRGYSVMATLNDLAFVAGSDGEVYMYRHSTRTVTAIAKTGRKVAGIFAEQLSINPCRIALLVTKMGKSTASLYYIDNAESCQETTQLDVQQLETPNGFVTTSFVWARTNGQDFAFLGSRNGSIAVFEADSKDSSVETAHTLQHIGAHAAETVTRLSMSPDSEKSDRLYLMSTGRDGTYAVHQFNHTESQTQMTTVHQVSLPFGPNIEGFGFSTSGHLCVWGFRSTQFVVFDIQTQQEVMAIECGGAHRIWSFRPNKNGGTFVWTKASKLYTQTQSQLPCQIINAGSHGREIKCVSVSPSDPRLIATGAEDTDIKLSVYQDSNFKFLHTLQKHNTGIQHLRWSSNGQYLFSSGGFEEFFIWKITKNIPHIGIGVVCESKHPRSGSSDLRIMYFDVHDHDNRSFHITTVYSDSTLKSWSYHPQSQTWILLAAGDYLTSCLTQCLHLDAPSTQYSIFNDILTAGTDGHVALWKPINGSEEQTGQWGWTLRHRIHQNAILALVSCNLPNQSRVLITGGDDNAIGITRVANVEDASGSSCRTLLLSRAHAAAVTALSLVKINEGSGELVGIWLVSTSIDQRVKLWKIDLDLGKDGIEGVDIKLVKNVFTSVADVSSMELLPLGNARGILVCGVGMDVWKIDESALD